MSGGPEVLSVAQLEARIRFHESTAAMYESRGEPTMARKFREMVAVYAEELECRLRRTGSMNLCPITPSERSKANDDQTD